MATELSVSVQSKTLRERWLLEGPSADGVDQDQVLKQLREDETRTRRLEEDICRSNEKLPDLFVFVFLFVRLTLSCTAWRRVPNRGSLSCSGVQGCAWVKLKGKYGTANQKHRAAGAR